MNWLEYSKYTALSPQIYTEDNIDELLNKLFELTHGESTDELTSAELDCVIYSGISTRNELLKSKYSKVKHKY